MHSVYLADYIMRAFPGVDLSRAGLFCKYGKERPAAWVDRRGEPRSGETPIWLDPVSEEEALGQGAPSVADAAGDVGSGAKVGVTRVSITSNANLPDDSAAPVPSAGPDAARGDAFKLANQTLDVFCRLAADVLRDVLQESEKETQNELEEYRKLEAQEEENEKVWKTLDLTVAQKDRAYTQIGPEATAHLDPRGPYDALELRKLSPESAEETLAAIRDFIRVHYNRGVEFRKPAGIERETGGSRKPL